MKNAPDEMWYTWEQGNFVGSNKPHTRIVLSKQTLRAYGGVEGGGGRFRTQLFGNPWRTDEWFEIPTVNIKTLTRNHKIGTDASTMTLTMANAEPISVGDNLDLGYDGSTDYPTKRDLKEIGAPGAFTYRRGTASDGTGPNPWGYVASTFVDAFLPNRLIWTFEGYGTDNATYPWDDTKLVQTGTWLIDRVSIDSKGDITVECRDLAKLLIEQRLYPPIVPLDNYPVKFCSDRYETDIVTDKQSRIISTPEVVGENVARHVPNGSGDPVKSYDSSAAPWYGYNAEVYGHRASHAFDGEDTSFWISMRNSQPDADWSYEWLDALTDGEPINRIKFRPWRGAYTLYVGVKEDGKWQGSSRVPYNRNAEPAYPNGSDIPYVKKFNMPNGENWFEIELDRIYNAERVRLVFTDLRWFGKISGGDYRAGVYEFEVSGYTPGGTTIEVLPDVEREVQRLVPGNIDDYTDMVKLFAAWAGFYWPKDLLPSGTESDPLFLKEEWGSEGGRVWGDFFYSGAYPVDPPCIDASYWDNKSVMDAINQVKETLGFVAYVDHTGGFVWRPPNIWSNGNYITGVGWRGDASIPVVAENNVLIDYGVTVDDAALRSEIVVVSAEDPTVYGSYSPGYATGEESPVSSEGGADPNSGGVAGFMDQDVTQVTDLSLLAGQQRVMLVPDYPFGQSLDDDEAARAEVEKFAYLTSLWIHWSYRKASMRIPANPALDPDDQIRIYEAKTSEVYIHYILGINTTLDMQTGSYVQDIETHWLGNGPDAVWHVHKNEMPPALYAYLCQQEIINCSEDGDGDVNPWTLPDPPVIPDTPLPDPRIDPDLEIPYPTIPDIDPIPPADDGIGGGDDPSGRGDPPSAGDGGSVPSCSNAFMWAYWPGTGPNPNTSSGTPVLTGAPASKRRIRGSSGSGGDMVLDNRAWPAFQLLGDVFDDVGVNIATASGKVFKKVSGTSQFSNHSWGTAADLNTHLRYGRSIMTYPASTRDAYLEIASRASSIRCYNNNGQLVRLFKWGEDFGKSNPARYDPMHWQICVPASWLARGVWDISKTQPPPYTGPLPQ